MLTHEGMFCRVGQPLPGIQDLQQVLVLLSLQKVPVPRNIGNNQNKAL